MTSTDFSNASYKRSLKRKSERRDHSPLNSKPPSQRSQTM
jgi:hypothetical protein